MLDHQWDLAADFRAIYRLSPAEALRLPGPEYLALCWRLPAYQGAMLQQLTAQQEKEEKARDDRTLPGDRASIEAQPADIAGLFEWG